MVKAADLVVKGVISQYSAERPTVQCYKALGTNRTLIPCRYAIRDIQYPHVEFPTEHLEKYPLRPDQEKVLEEFDAECKRQDEEKRICYTLFGHIYTGFGKSAIGSIYAARQKGPILIICDSDAIRQGWIKTWKMFFNMEPHCASGKHLGKHDVCILSRQLANIHQFSREEYSHYKVVICDEADTLCTQQAVNVLLDLRPKYLIGFTATVKKSNGLDKVLDIFWDDRKHWVQRLKHFDETCSMNLHILHTKHTIDNLYNRKMGIDWTGMGNMAASIPERNILIRNLCIMHQQKKILILCKTVNHVTELAILMRKAGLDVATYYEKDKSYYDAHVLITTMSKGGRGYDDKNVSSAFDGKRFDMEILTLTMRDTEQAVGRALRGDHVDVYVLVDNNSIMMNHAESMKKVYGKKGASIYEEYM